MSSVLKQVIGLHVVFGGEEPSGWIPDGAATPKPTPKESEVVDVQIIQDKSGFLLEWTARQSETNPEPGRAPKSGDLWYERLEDAEEAAEQHFGITASDWSTVSDPHATGRGA